MKRINSALWTDGVQDESMNFEVHFNIWKVDCVDCIDIGISYDVKYKIEKIYMYINCGNINKNDIQDISNYLEDPFIAKLIFNQDVIINASELKNHFLLYTNESQYCICRNNDIKIERKIEDGIIFSISIDTYMKYNYRNYIRLRVFGNIINKHTNKQLSIEERFEYHSLQFEIFEFRFNDKRSFLSDFAPIFPKVKMVRCFLILDSMCDIVLCNKSYKNVRILETSDWEKYLPQLGKYKKENFLVYQWNDGKSTEDYIEHFSLFTKIKKPIFTYNKFIVISFFVFSMGILTSLCASFVYSLLTH